jgi:hypothetical protein
LSWEIEDGNVGALLCSFEDDLLAVWGDIKVADIEIGREVSELALGAGVEVQEPEILVFDLTVQEHKSAASREEGDVAGAAREG